MQSIIYSDTLALYKNIIILGILLIYTTKKLIQLQNIKNESETSVQF